MQSCTTTKTIIHATQKTSICRDRAPAVRAGADRSRKKVGSQRVSTFRPCPCPGHAVSASLGPLANVPFSPACPEP